MEDQATTLNTANARIACTSTPATSTWSWVSSNRNPDQVPRAPRRATARHGPRDHADSHGNGTVSESRLYHLIRQHGHLADRSFEITFLDPGVQAYAFTFRLDHEALPCHPCRLVPVRHVNADLLDVRYVEPGAVDGQLVILHGFP